MKKLYKTAGSSSPSRQPMLVECRRLKDSDIGELEEALRESSLFSAPISIKTVGPYIVSSATVRFAHGTGYATACVRLLSMTPSRQTSFAAVCTGVPCLV